MHWFFEDQDMQFSLSIADDEFVWSSTFDDCGRELNSTCRQSATSFFERGPAFHPWPFYETPLPFTVLDKICTALKRPRPEWWKPLVPDELALFSAARHPDDSSRAVKAVLARGVAVDTVDGCGFTPLCGSSYFGDPYTTLALLTGGAEKRRILERVAGYETVLHAAASRGYPSIGDKLKGTLNFNIVKDAGKTALFYVSLQPALHRTTSAQVTRSLLVGGADPNHRCASGETPLGYARRRQLGEMEELLLAAGARE